MNAEVPKHLHAALSDLAMWIEHEFGGPNWMTTEDLQEFCRARELDGYIYDQDEISQLIERAFTKRTIAFSKWLGHWRNEWYGPEIVFERQRNR